MVGARGSSISTLRVLMKVFLSPGLFPAVWEPCRWVRCSFVLCYVLKVIHPARWASNFPALIKPEVQDPNLTQRAQAGGWPRFVVRHVQTPHVRHKLPLNPGLMTHGVGFRLVAASPHYPFQFRQRVCWWNHSGF